MIVARSGTIQLHGEADGLAILGSSQHKVKIPRMKAEDNFSGRRLQHCALRTHLPTSTQRPLIERKSGLWRIRMFRILSDRLSGGEVFCPMVADIGFR